MDNLKYQEEIKSLKTLADHYEAQLKLVNIELCEFNGSELDILEVCTGLQADLYIHDLKNLHEFYYEKKKDGIEHKVIVMQQTAGVNELKTVIAETDKEIDILERFIETAKARRIPDAELQQRKNHLEATKQALLDRQISLKTINELNLDALMDKIDILELEGSK
ncbi:augmin complex subunit wac [Drosophila tropicalis]|uniref:augmin complex subunit wac n=1 Tax=Drosophila tropicalis TaxID=46794 RepID=UPI0035AB9BCF